MVLFARHKSHTVNEFRGAMGDRAKSSSVSDSVSEPAAPLVDDGHETRWRRSYTIAFVLVWSLLAWAALIVLAIRFFRG
jgi:hypothetical protein